MKSILVTGAGSGIGKATARYFAEQGWYVALCDLNTESLQTVERELPADQCDSFPLDVTRYSDFERVIDSVSSRTDGRLDVLFNCAGIMRMGPFEEVSIEDHHLTTEINIIGVINGIYASLPLLKNTPGARIITMSSAAAFYGVPDLAGYSASKFAVRGLTEALNLEFEPYDIVVTDLMPLYVDTPMISSQKYQAGTLRYFGTRLTAEDIAKVVWDATRERRIHWIPGLTLKALKFITRFFPFAERRAMRAFSKQKRKDLASAG